MSTHLFSNLPDNAVLYFDYAEDNKLIFDDPEISAANVQLEVGGYANPSDGYGFIVYSLTVNGKTVELHLQTDYEGSDYSSRTDQFIEFADGSQILPGNVQGTDGNDLLLNDSFYSAVTMSGGAGNDAYIIRGYKAQVVEAAGNGIDTVRSYINHTLGNNVEHLQLMSSADLSGRGNALNNRVTGNAGNNQLGGGDGADSLYGNAGNDTLYGDSGKDRLAGGAGNDLLYGDAGDDWLDGGSGDDIFVGGAGNDTYVLDVNDPTREFVVEEAGGGIDTVISSVNLGLYGSTEEVENLTLTGSAIYGSGNQLDNRLTGNSANNSLAGYGGADWLDGGAGADTLEGGDGNDTYVVDNLNDTVRENSAGNDTVRSSISYTLGQEVENLTLTAYADINGTGNGLDNYLRGHYGRNVLTGGAGNDTIDGSRGTDTLVGGDGNDTYVIGPNGIGFDPNTGEDALLPNDVIVEAPGAGIDSVISSVDYTLAANVEHLLLTGIAMRGTGNGLNNRLIGNANYNDSLAGAAGNDTLDGSGGNDTMSGGSGSDVFVLRTAAPTYYTPGDRITDFVSGTDKLQIAWGPALGGKAVGDGDAVPESAQTIAGPHGFSRFAELVIVTGNITGDITTTTAATAIGSASSAYASGATALFAVDNGSSSAVYLFTSSGLDAQVSASELTLLATLQGTASTSVGDYLFAVS